MSLDPALSHVSCVALYPSCGPEGPWLYGDLILPDKKHMTPGSGARQAPGIAMTG